MSGSGIVKRYMYSRVVYSPDSQSR